MISPAAFDRKQDELFGGDRLRPRALPPGPLSPPGYVFVRRLQETVSDGDDSGIDPFTTRPEALPQVLLSMATALQSHQTNIAPRRN